MKNCDEMVNSLLERREQYEADKKRKRKMLTRTLTPICCVCLIALIGFGAWQGGMLSIFNEDNGLTAEDAIYPGTKDWYGPGESENENSQSNGGDQSIVTQDQMSGVAEETDSAKQLCYVNKIENIASSALAYLDPAKHHTEEWDDNKVASYLGIDLTTIHEDVRVKDLEYQYVNAREHSIIFNNDGTMVRDIVAYDYQNTNSEITITASKLVTPYDCIYSLDEEVKTNCGTKNGNVEVLFASSSGDVAGILELIVADFELKGVQYRVEGQNIALIDFFNFVFTILNK